MILGRPARPTREKRRAKDLIAHSRGPDCPLVTTFLSCSVSPSEGQPGPLCCCFQPSVSARSDGVARVLSQEKRLTSLRRPASLVTGESEHDLKTKGRRQRPAREVRMFRFVPRSTQGRALAAIAPIGAAALFTLSPTPDPARANSQRHREGPIVSVQSAFHIGCSPIPRS